MLGTKQMCLNCIIRNWMQKSGQKKAANNTNRIWQLSVLPCQVTYSTQWLNGQSLADSWQFLSPLFQDQETQISMQKEGCSSLSVSVIHFLHPVEVWSDDKIEYMQLAFSKMILRIFACDIQYSTYNIYIHIIWSFPLGCDTVSVDM